MKQAADVLREFAGALILQADDLSNLADTNPYDQREAQERYHGVMELAEQFRKEYVVAVDIREGFK